VALFELTELASYVQSDLDTATATLAQEQAVAYLEAETGVRLTEQTGSTVTYQVRWDDAWIDLPIPTTAVTAVTIDGTVVDADDYQVVNNRLYRRVGWGGSRWTSDNRFAYRSSEDDYVSVAVTMDFGYSDLTAPAEFKTWALVLAAQAYQLAPKIGLQSFRIDDYSETYATGGGAALMGAGMSLPPNVLGKLKARYGRGAKVVETR
jgi:hypothetical protein